MRNEFAGHALAVLLAAASAVPPLAQAAAANGANYLRVDDLSGCTADPAASTTVPGWIAIEGSPALRCPSMTGFATPGSASIEPGLISSGPYGSAALERSVALGGDAAAIDRGAALYRLSAWFGTEGSGRARAILTLIFRDAAGRPLPGSVRRDGPAGVGGAPRRVFAARAASGTIPRGSRSIGVVLRFINTDAPHDTAYADRLSLTLWPELEPQPPSPPPSTIPRFDHVFLILMENTDYRQVIGDAKDAPFINGLAGRGTLLARYSGVYHPSDENYLAIANGDAAVRGAAYFPNIHLAVRHLGDSIEAAGKTWKAYEQGMGSACNTTIRYDKYYEPDDAPFVNYTNVIGDAKRCRAHLFDTAQLAIDLKSAAATPNFAWIAADDYDDGEVSGNGSPASLRVQDGWLRRTLQPLFASPAWREQRCLLILTWDESDSTRDNHIAAILVGSRGSVRAGFVSEVRYDHYSAARTIEAALRLPSLTANDKFARPINDAFVRRRN
ncbi:MAG TPA: alkaline phosphatase family protein [Steroidobacteraceae bacterium]|nr:alkaline phosphatase family protein [Steroidobacteraceae bacterium]